MGTWFKAEGYGIQIVPVEVIRTTAQSVVVSRTRPYGKPIESMTRKRTDYDNYFPTWEEAKDYLVEREMSKVVRARLQLDHANASLGNAKGLKKPKLAAVAAKGE